MVYSANNEQRMEFLVHNTVWRPVDFEGLTLMMRPAATASGEESKTAPSKAAIGRMIQRKCAGQSRNEKKAGYVVIDIETTGLDLERSEILEIGAARIIDHQIDETFSALICTKQPVPDEITALTGITQHMAEEGSTCAEALEKFWNFVGQSAVVGHNLSFDLAFLKKASAEMGIAVSRNSCIDMLTLARRKIRDISDHRLETLADYFGVKPERFHRALEDCRTTAQIYEKLNEI